MNPRHQRAAYLTRRQFFSKTAVGIGGAALGSLLTRDGFGAISASVGPGNARVGGLDGLPHFAPKAKHVIYLLQNGAPPHLDTFDYKPEMEKWRGTGNPGIRARRQAILHDDAGAKVTSLVLPHFIVNFKQFGNSGAWVCDFLPHTAEIVDDLCFVKSMHTDAVNHAPGDFLFSHRCRATRPAEHGRVG